MCRKVQVFNRTLNKLGKQVERTITTCKARNDKEKSITMEDFGFNKVVQQSDVDND